MTSRGGDFFAARLDAARRRAGDELRRAAGPAGHWEGCLAASALSTATAVCALSLLDRHAPGDGGGAGHAALVQRGLEWLAGHANPDGGWGDTVRSHSNLSTTTLVWAALGAVPGAGADYAPLVARAEAWITARAGGLAPAVLAPAIAAVYGRDRTFSVPILTMCALAGRLGPTPGAWEWVAPLPFELAALPHQWYAAVRLPVVSYALPALIAIGQARHHHRPPGPGPRRWLRNAVRRRTLDLLGEMQPASGGFLEATPLTSFVLMSLASMGAGGHPAARRCAEFLVAAARPDGSWPIDSNLSLWLTTLAVNALPAGGDEDFRAPVRAWLRANQSRAEHPYTHAAPGAWAWTDLPGGVPDADDTAGALLALHRLGPVDDDALRQAAAAGVAWLLNLQNRDGGMPTFCRGWGTLPFDRSGADLTAHALRAWAVWRPELPAKLRARVRGAAASAVTYLARTQRADGSWVPLWFGNQHHAAEENPTYGTAKVLPALVAAQGWGDELAGELLERGCRWLLAAQHPDGAWGGGPGLPASVEETALAVEALAGVAEARPEVLAAVAAGAAWLVERVERGEWRTPAPIGFYFARLWYFEELYPVIFTVAALERAAAVLPRPPAG